MERMVLSAQYALPGSHTGLHLHDCHQILYVTAGQAQITVSGQRYTVKPGSLVLINRFESHSVEDCSHDYRRCSLQISPAVSTYGSFVGHTALSILTNRPAHFRHAVDMSGCSETEPLFCRMADEFSSAPQSKLLELYLMELILYLYRAHPELAAPADGSLKVVRQVQAYLESNYTNKITLRELSGEFHISASYLSHIFKRITGTSPMGYLYACRLAEAKQQLIQTDLPISTIVSACGYSDCSNFSRSFLAATGMTPTQFRHKYRINTEIS
jgi:AraC-like DNA-binding protein